SEEHTSELQSREKLVCRLLLEKKHHAHREQGARAPRGEVGERVAQRQQHAQNTSRSVCATGRRAAPNEGTTPEIIPTNSARNSGSNRHCARIVLVTPKLPSGRSAESRAAPPWRSEAVSASAPEAPSAAPRVEGSVASALFVHDTAPPEIHTLSLHDALPI